MVLSYHVSRPVTGRDCCMRDKSVTAIDMDCCDLDGWRKNHGGSVNAATLRL